MIKLNNSWLNILKGEFEKDYMLRIKSFLESEIKKGKIIYPHPKNVFNALELTNFVDVKVVIIGQDPYHGEGQAHGLSFSVPDGIKIPPSLRNIYKELGKVDEKSGNLENWAKQGVLLLNAVLTVEKAKPASHSKIGWQDFTDEIIKQISEKRENIVFLLWGAFAHTKEKLIDSNKHLILKTTHPSPFSAHRGFLGSNCFVETNKYLNEKGIEEIGW